MPISVDYEMNGLKLLLKLTGLCSITPRTAFSGKIGIQRNKPFIQATCFAISLVVITFASMYFSVAHNYLYRGPLIVLLRVLVVAVWIVLGVEAVLSPVSNYKAWHEFFEILKDVPGRLKNKHILCYPQKYLVIIELAMLNGFALAIFIMNAFTKLFLLYYQFALEYLNTITIVLAIHLIIILKQEYQYMNKTLKRFRCLPLKNRKNVDMVDVARDLQKNYIRLNKLVTYFNEIFGYQILFILAYIVLLVLQIFADVRQNFGSLNAFLGFRQLMAISINGVSCHDGVQNFKTLIHTMIFKFTTNCNVMYVKELIALCVLESPKHKITLRFALHIPIAVSVATVT